MTDPVDMAAGPIFTIGHSNHSLEGFLALLAKRRIAAVADVRSAPYSRFNSHFDREALAAALEACGIGYRYFGRELGGRPDDPGCYENGRVIYDRVARTARFRDGLARVREAAAEVRLALMCAEKEPLDCHRALLIARALDGKGVRVAHILADGSEEAHTRTIERSMPMDDLFQSRDERFAERARRAAWAGEAPSVKRRPPR